MGHQSKSSFLAESTNMVEVASSDKHNSLEYSGLYYKHVMIVNDASSGVNKWHYNLERHFCRR